MNEKAQIRVLLVEDSATDALLLRETLSDIPGVEYALTHVERLADCLVRLGEETFDVLLLDLGLPDSRGVDTFIRLHQHEPGLPVLVLTGLDDEATGMKTLQEGAQDYLIKHQLQASLLGRSIRYAIERHRIATELHHSERRFRALIEHGADSVAVIDANNNIKYLSPAVTAVEGYRPEELVGRNGMENTHPDDLPLVQEIVQKLMANPGKPVPVLWRRRHKDGRWLWLEGVATNLLHDPAVQGIVTNYRDISERKQNEEAMETERERLRTTVQNMPVMMDAFDEHGNIIVWNRECELVSGYSKEEMVGNPKAMELLYPDADYLNKMMEEWRRRANNYRDWAWEMTCKDGAVKTVLWSNSSSIFPIPGWATWGIGVDISARQRAEDLIKASLKEKEVLLKEIHHRVKNNLQVIISLLNLQSKKIKDKQALEVFREGQHRVRAMAIIHEELYQSANLAKIEMASYLRTLTTHLSQSYQGNVQGVEMDVRVKNVLLEIGQAIPCGLIINELVTNSLKYAFPDAEKKSQGKKNEIIIEMRAIDDSRLLLRVSDNGVGLPKTFDVQNSESLGLQLVHTLAEQLRGNIECKNSSGAEFAIDFPVS